MAVGVCGDLGRFNVDIFLATGKTEKRIKQNEQSDGAARHSIALSINCKNACVGVINIAARAIDVAPVLNISIILHHSIYF